MVEHTELVSVVHETVSLSKETSALLQNSIADSFAGEVRLPVETVAAAASLLRANSTLVAGLLEENSRILDTLNAFISRINR